MNRNKRSLADKNRFKFSKTTKKQFKLREEDIPMNMRDNMGGEAKERFKDMLT